MQIILLSIHLLVCVCLIGLVLLQRSEGGALGIGGGGGGALMSGRGASDALARLTYIAGALFLGVSLLLTWLSTADRGFTGQRGVFDSVPAASSPVVPESAPSTVEPTPAAPDPTESRAPSATELAAAVLPGPTSASATETAAPSSARAVPIESRPEPVQQAAAQQRRPASNQGAAAQPALAPGQNSISGVALDEPSTPESVDLGNGVGVVRRERAGPDQ